VIYTTRKLINLTVNFLAELGGFLTLFVDAVAAFFRRPIRWAQIMKQLEFIGVRSSFIIILTGLFTGAVLALQSGKAFRLFNAEGVTGSVVALSLLRELSPVMTGLMVAARCGSAMAAELGTMNVTQQIDALRVMSVNPIGYLVAPRVFATIVMLPLLCILFSLMGMFGSYVVCIVILDINDAVYFDMIHQYVEMTDLWHGLVKATFFGVIVSVVGCHRGYHTRGGAEGVGRATTQAVVIASVTILVADYFLTAFMF